MSNCNCHTAFPFSTCNPSIASSLVYYSGPNLPCSGINNKDSITIAIQKIDAQLCGENLVNNVFTEILNNADLYQQFVDLVNGAIDCSTILACLTTTTTTSSTTSTTSTSTTTACPNTNLLINGDFAGNLAGWSQTIGGDWIWSSSYGGSANFDQRDELGLLYQDILTPGVIYNITFTLHNTSSGDISGCWIKVFAGTTEYGPISPLGATNISIQLTAADTSRFAFQVLDTCDLLDNNFFVSNVVVSLPCTTTTTTTTAIPCSRWGYNYASFSCNLCEFIDYGFLYNSNPLTLDIYYSYEGLVITPYEFVGCDSGDSDASIPDTGVITCEEIVCTTTTTTTIAPRVCAIYGLQATILEGSWSALDCLGEPVNGLLTSGDTTYTPCIDVSTLEMVDGEIKQTINC